MRLILFFFFITTIVSCTKKDKLDIDVSNIEVETIIKRFEQDYYSSSASELPNLKKVYPYLFPSQTPDSIWAQKMQDKDEQELFTETQKEYTNFTNEKEQLTNLFKHITYYYPKFKAPKTITLLSNVDYTNSVIYADSLLLISLDVYLGKDSKIYSDFPKYIRRNFRKEHLIVDVANAISTKQIPASRDRTFISRMIQKGKKLYVLDAYLPQVSDAEKIGYTQEQIDWANSNDVEIWKYFVQNKLLFSNDYELSKRFINTAPFSKFNKADDNKTPGRIGEWFGWQIVKSYMKNNNTTLIELLRIPNDKIFKKSKYKPVK